MASFFILLVLFYTHSCAVIFDEYDLLLNKMRWHFIFRSQQCMHDESKAKQNAYLLFINCHRRNHIIFIHEIYTNTGLPLAHFVFTYNFVFAHYDFFTIHILSGWLWRQQVEKNEHLQRQQKIYMKIEQWKALVD